MRQFKQHWSTRPLSWLLSALMLWPAVLALMFAAPQSARAQLNGPPVWAVLDFENSSGYGRGEVGRIASDAFVVELGKSNKYDVLSRADTQSAILNNGISTPPDAIGLQRLGRALSAAAVATGRVAAISFTNSPRQATVSVLISVTDSSTGELVNGALAQGRSNPRAIGNADDDALVNEAINNAAFAAVRQITQFNLPKATVLNARDQSSVLLNRGSRDGMRDGLNMVVTRNGAEVGRIRVSNASSDQSDAVVVERGLGIQPGDRATAIYQLPSYTVSGGVLNARDVSSDDSTPAARRQSAFKGVTGILIALLAGALLLSLIKRGSSSGSLGGATVGKAIAIEGRRDLLGGQGYRPGTQLDVHFLGDPATPNDPYVPIVVNVTATTGNIPYTNFIEYHVYRSNFPFFLNDAGSLPSNTGGNSGSTTGNSSFGQVPVIVQHSAQPLSVFDDGGDVIGVTATKPVPNLGGTSGNSGSGTTGSGSTGVGNTTTTVTVTPTAPAIGLPGTGIPAVGSRFNYFVEGLYIQPATDGGSTTNPGLPGNTTSGNTSGSGTGSTSGGTSGNTSSNGGHSQTFQLTGRTPTNYVTFIEPVLLTADTSFLNGSGPDNIVINVKSTPSGDDYVLELSADIGFRNRVRLTPGQTGGSTGPYSADPLNPQTGAGNTPVTWFLRNNVTGKDYRAASLVPNADQIFARIGTRDSRNGPLESINPYVYSDPVKLSDAVFGATASAVSRRSGVRHR